MKKILIFTILLVCSLFPKYVDAAVSTQKIAKVYSNLSQKLESKYTLQKQILVFEDLRDSLSKISEKKLSGDKKIIVSELERHNNNYLLTLYTQRDTDVTSQKALELQTRLQLKKTLSGEDYPSHIKTLKGKGKSVYNTNETYDFVEGNTMKKIRFSRFYTITSSNVRQFYNTKGIVIHTPKTGKYIFVEDYTLEERVPYSQLQQTFPVFITSKTNYILENGVYYAYIFESSSFLEDTYGVYLQNLERLSLTSDASILYKNTDGRYSFATNYTKKKLISADILDGVADKQVFLEYILDDKRELNTETDNLFRILKQTTAELSEGKKKQEKIAAIYDWILGHVSYSEDVDLSNSKIFSGIDTYKNADGVCSGYSKLTAYMLMFAGIHDSQVVTGDVIDATDFPQIGHAWIRIGDRYYDPTFDDPVGLPEKKNPDTYLYYNLPRDLFYTNRYDKGETPQPYKSLNLSKREDIVAQNLFNISDSYSSRDYNILQSSDFRKQHNLSYNTQITPSVLGDIIGVHNVKNGSFSFTQNGKKKSITSIRYYIIDKDTTQTALAVMNYDLSDSYLFLWEKPDGTKEYRLSYEITIQ